MLNKEKYHDEIFEITCRDYCVAVVNGKSYGCGETDCENCIFYEAKGPCKVNFKKWLNEEYKEPLKPCPFCGSKDVAVNKCVGAWIVQCGDCLTVTRACYTEEQATETWNRRTKDED